MTNLQLSHVLSSFSSSSATKSFLLETLSHIFLFPWEEAGLAGVVSKMVILAQSSNFQNCIKKTNKIPEYARDYKKEYLLIIGINKEFRYFVEHIHESPIGLFENHRVARIKYFIKRFLKGQERGKLQDTSNFEIESRVVDNLIKIKKNFLNFNQYINFCKCCYHEDDVPFIDPYPGFKNIYDDFELFCSKFKIKYEDGGSFWDHFTDSDSDSD